jgi:hypothetical protein
VSVSRLGRLGLVVRADIVWVAGDVTCFRFSDGPFSGVEGGERSFVRAEAGLESCWIQLSTRNVFAAAIEGDNGGVVAIIVGVSGGCLPARSDARHLTRLGHVWLCRLGNGAEILETFPQPRNCNNREIKGARTMYSKAHQAPD